jgi:SET and MYND domain-containing protein
VAISPLPALINHSCRPNAVILFPHSIKTKQPVLNVVAISPIKPGEEVMPSSNRRTQLT